MRCPCGNQVSNACIDESCRRCCKNLKCQYHHPPNPPKEECIHNTIDYIEQPYKGWQKRQATISKYITELTGLCNDITKNILAAYIGVIPYCEWCNEDREVNEWISIDDQDSYSENCEICDLLLCADCSFCNLYSSKYCNNVNCNCHKGSNCDSFSGEPIFKYCSECKDEAEELENEIYEEEYVETN